MNGLMTIVVRLEYTSVHIIKAQTAVARERQRSAETVLITIFSETVSQHTKLLAVVEERADTDAAIASQETVKLSVGFPLSIFRILTADDVEVFATFFSQRGQRETDTNPIIIALSHDDVATLDFHTGHIHALVCVVGKVIARTKRLRYALGGFLYTFI